MADRAEVSQDVSTLQRRGRRRLVGAIALVLLSVIVLPMVFDPDPKPAPPPVNVRIPGEDESRFVPKVVPKGAAPAVAEADKKKGASVPEAVASAPVPPVAPVAPEPPKAEPKPAAKAEPVPVAPKPETPKPEAPKPEAAKAVPAKPDAAKPPAKMEPKPAPAKAAAPAVSPSATPAATGQFYVQVGAFADAEKVREIGDKLKAAKLAYYTESVATASGSVTRIRLGPYASREAAEKARESARGLGLSPGNAAAK